MKTHKDLDVWKKALELAESIYSVTAEFPKEEQFGLTAQIRRAAVSIASNIAEGAARNSNKEFMQFLYVAMGSLSEVETQLLLAERLRLTNKIMVYEDVESIRKMLLGLIKFLKKRNNA